MNPRDLEVRVGPTEFRVEVPGDGSVSVRSREASGSGARDDDVVVPLRAHARDLGDGRVHVVTEHHAVLAHAVDGPDRRWVFVDGCVFETQVAAAGSRAAGRRRAAGVHDSLVAPMPARVARVLVAAGQEVERGATLLVLEAMKMELPLRAPRAAVVEAVRCAEGDLVEPNVPLVELDARVEAT